MDVVTAFLNPEVDDPGLYMAIPEGWDSSSSGNDATGDRNSGGNNATGDSSGGGNDATGNRNSGGNDATGG